MSDLESQPHPDATGNHTSNELSTGEKTFNEHPTGHRPTSEHFTDEIASDVQPTGERPSASFSTGEMPSAAQSSHDRRKFREARIAVLVTELLSVVVAVSLLVHPVWFKVQLLLCGLLPILAMGVYHHLRGYLRPDLKPSRRNPHLWLSFLLPPAVVLLRGLLDVEMPDLHRLAWLLPAAFVLYLLPVWLTAGWFDFTRPFAWVSLSLLLLSGILWSAGVITSTNAVFDPTPREFQEVPVLSKHQGQGHDQGRYLLLAPWGTFSTPVEVRVSRKTYGLRNPDCPAIVLSGKGLYGIPYYRVN